MAGGVHRGAAGAREIFEDRGPLADRGGPAERGLPYLGLFQPQRAGRGTRELTEGSGVAGVPWQGSRVSRGDALDHHAAGVSLALAIRLAGRFSASAVRGSCASPNVPM